MNIQGKHSLIHQLVYEVRYNQGFLFLDRCGVTANRIMSSYPEWMVKNQDLNPQNAPLVSVRNGTRFSYNALKYDCALEQPSAGEKALSEEDVKEFVAQADSLSRIVHEELELKDFTRVGFRIWYLFGGKSKSDCEQWIQELGGFKIGDSLKSAFKGTIESQNHVVVIKSQDRNIRIAVNGVESQQQLDLGNEILRVQPHKLPKQQREILLKQERARQRILSNPTYAAMIDIDAFVENPVDAVASDFILESLRQIENGLPKSFPGR